MTEAIGVLRDARLLDARTSGAAYEPARVDVDAAVTVPAGAASARLWVLAAREAGTLTGTIDGQELGRVTTTGAVHRVELGDTKERRAVRLRLHEASGLRAVWLVPWPTALPDLARARAAGLLAPP